MLLLVDSIKITDAEICVLLYILYEKRANIVDLIIEEDKSTHTNHNGLSSHHKHTHTHTRCLFVSCLWVSNDGGF